MNLLLDTHTAMWFFGDDERLSKSAIEAICSSDNKKYISIASVWEVAIKLSIEKLKFDGGIENFVKVIKENGFLLLEISAEHIETITELPFIHRDPFDRMLVAQAMVEGMTIMTADANILKYDINRIW